MQGQRGASVLSLILLAFFCGLFAYQRYRQRAAPPGGPPDPSAHWIAGDNRRSNEVMVFRYSPGSIKAVRIVMLLSLLPGFIIYAVSRSRPVGAELGFFIPFFVALFGVAYLAYKACEKYAVEVNDTEIVHYRLRAPLKYPFASLGSVALLEGGGRGPKYVLALFDQKGKCMDQFADTLDGFNELVALVKRRAAEVGVKYRYRDMWGSWTHTP
jgi:hypothetical protein